MESEKRRCKQGSVVVFVSTGRMKYFQYHPVKNKQQNQKFKIDMPVKYEGVETIRDPIDKSQRRKKKQRTG
jgi:hypothetical protein